MKLKALLISIFLFLTDFKIPSFWQKYHFLLCFSKLVKRIQNLTSFDKVYKYPFLTFNPKIFSFWINKYLYILKINWKTIVLFHGLVIIFDLEIISIWPFQKLYLKNVMVYTLIILYNFLNLTIFIVEVLKNMFFWGRNEIIKLSPFSCIPKIVKRI